MCSHPMPSCTKCMLYIPDYFVDLNCVLCLALLHTKARVKGRVHAIRHHRGSLRLDRRLGKYMIYEGSAFVFVVFVLVWEPYQGSWQAKQCSRPQASALRQCIATVLTAHATWHKSFLAMCCRRADGVFACVYRYALSSYNIFKACLRREYIIMKRNALVFSFRIGQVTWDPSSSAFAFSSRNNSTIALLSCMHRQISRAPVLCFCS